MLTALSLTLLTCLCTVAEAPVFPIQVTGEWRVELGAAAVKGVTLSKPVAFDVAPPRRVSVKDEPHASLPLYNPDAGVGRGAKPRGIQTIECTTPGGLYPESLRQGGTGDAAPVFTEGKDYQLAELGSFGRAWKARIAEDRNIHRLRCRSRPVDTIAVDASGTARS